MAVTPEALQATVWLVGKRHRSWCYWWGRARVLDRQLYSAERIHSRWLFLAFEQIEPITTETPAIGLDHTFGAALRNVHLGTDGVRHIEKIRRVSMLDSSHRFAGVGEGGPACLKFGRGATIRVATEASSGKTL